MNVKSELLRACLVIALASVAVPHAALAAELDAQRQAVINSMYAEGAVVTEKIHSDFWAGLEDQNNPNNPNTQASMQRLSAALKNAMELESAKVASYLASIKQRRPVVDPSYELALTSRLETIRTRNLSPDLILAKDKAFRELLVPISKGKSIEANGSKLVMNEFLLNKVLRNIEATHVRLERLLNPVWTQPAN